MPWVSVDDTNGNVFVTYFCMENMTNFSTNTFVAASVNGFTTFQNRVVSDVMHVTAAIPQFGGGYAGDYIGMSSNGGRGFAAWMDDRNGTWQNYVSEVRVADIELTGNPLLCGTANTYTLTGVPAGSTVTWQQPAPAGIVTMNTSGNTATLTRNGSANGVVTLSANVSEGTCAYGLFSIQITVGNVTNITGYYRDNYGQNTSLLKSYEGINFVQPNVGSTAIVITPEWAAATWSLENGSCNYWTQSPSPDGNLLVMNLSQGADVDFRLTNNSTCGTEYFDFIFYGQSAYGGYYRISPNPTKGNIDISVDEAKLSANRIAKSSGQDIREIVILDKTGMVQAKQSFGKGTRQMNINIYNLKTGIYIVRIFNGKEWTALKLVKE